MRQITSGPVKVWLSRVAVALLIAIAFSAVGLTVQQARASVFPCHNDSCNAGSNAHCKLLDCDYCDQQELTCKESGLQ